MSKYTCVRETGAQTKHYRSLFPHQHQLYAYKAAKTSAQVEKPPGRKAKCIKKRAQFQCLGLLNLYKLHIATMCDSQTLSLFSGRVTVTQRFSHKKCVWKISAQRRRDYFQPQCFIALFWKLQMTFTPVYRSGALLKTVIGINCDLTILHMQQFSHLQSVKGFSFYPEQKQSGLISVLYSLQMLTRRTFKNDFLVFCYRIDSRFEDYWG